MTSTTDLDYSVLTDAQLALALQQIYSEYSADADTFDEESMIFAESEVCDRANIPADETEQGLTDTAVGMIREWMAANGAVMPF